MNDSLQSLNGAEIAALVSISQAHGIRTQARRSARALKTAFDAASSRARSAESSARSLGHYDDCGPGYMEEFKAAEAVLAAVKPLFDAAVDAEIAAEKDYTRIKRDQTERHPSIRDHVARLISSSNVTADAAAA